MTITTVAAPLTNSDIRSIAANLSNVELHHCLADYSVSNEMGTEVYAILRAEAKSRNLI